MDVHTVGEIEGMRADGVMEVADMILAAPTPPQGQQRQELLQASLSHRWWGIKGFEMRRKGAGTGDSPTRLRNVEVDDNALLKRAERLLALIDLARTYGLKLQEAVWVDGGSAFPEAATYTDLIPAGCRLAAFGPCL